MNKRWITFVLVIYLGYALMFHQQKQPHLQGGSVPEEKHEVLDKIKVYTDILTADPKTNSLISDKEQPILANKFLEETEGLKASPAKQSNQKPNITNEASEKKSMVNPAKPTEEQQLNLVQNKIFNVIYNVLHTPQGGALIEKLILSPPVDDKIQEKDLYHNNSRIDILQGDGEPAGCGDIVTAHYITRLVNGQEIENTYKNNQPASFQLGDQKVIKGLEYAIIGMKKGGIRRLVTPPKLAYNKQKFSRGLIAGNEFVTLDIELIDIKSSLNNWQSIINIIERDDNKHGKPVLCSDRVYFKYKISNLKEKVIAKSDQPVSFILGSNEVPPAINKIFTDIRNRSKRVVILPSSLLYNRKISFLPATVKFPAKETLLMEIETSKE